MLYLIIFSVSCFLINCAERSIKKYGNKWLYGVLVAVAILLTAAMAGFRDYTIGSDVLAYGNSTFFISAHYNELDNCINGIALESGYVTLNYVISRFTNDPHWFYFFIALLMNLFIIVALHKYKGNNKFSEALGMFIYYCTFYNQSLNAMRQSLAVAVLFLAVVYMFSEKYIKSMILCLAATLFHTSAVIFVLFIPIYILIKKYPTLKMCILIIAGSIIIVSMYSTISQWLIDKGIFPEKYDRYMVSQNEYTFKWDSLVVRAPIIILALINFKKFKEANKINVFLLLMLVCEIVFMQLAVFVEYASRINIYIMIFRVFLFYNLISASYESNEKSKGYLMEAIIIVYIIVVWGYSVIILDNDGTYPYTSSILGIG